MTLLKKIDAEKNMNRWYSVHVQSTLLDPWAVICVWGRRDTSCFRMRILPVDSWEAAEMLARELLSRKLRRGYKE
jgi:predicted DNA-binding WGR domain protein